VTKLLQECRERGNVILMIDEVRAAAWGAGSRLRQPLAGAASYHRSLSPALVASSCMHPPPTPLLQVHTLVGAGAVGRGGGGGGGLDISNLIKPALARGDLQCIGATTLDEHRKHIERDAALER
jgi:ATP-dependent Clp protease ATP-binding subunit ClpA